MASLSLLEKNSNRQLAIIKRLKTSFDHYMQSFGEDGVCVEGVSYWSYGFGYYLYFAEKYYSVYKDDSFLNQPKIKEIAAFPYRVQLDQESFVPFSDAGRKERLPSGLLSFCQEQYDVVVPYYQEAPSLHVDHCYRWAPLYRNLIWTKELKKCASNKISYFPDAEWLVAKGQNDFVFAAKGGNNNESHNHNDVGHFVIGMAGELLLTDLGVGEYTRDYFLEETRYHILNNRSLGHSVPILNDKEQRSGAGGAEGTHFLQSETGFQFEMNGKEVYPEDANVTNFHRKWEVDLENGNALLHDRIHFSCSSFNLVQQNFISTERPIVEASSVIWKGKESTLRMHTDLQCFEPIIVEEEFSDHDGRNQKAYRTVLSTRVEMDYEQKFYFSIET
ncbi:heparinase II/III family protein [Jeotgalibaca caeni]|uniref:heparinase II/III family protein n=1 Tax=Jeotgalibaca caeni TaxID=3028623 RepID=UPI00237E7E59|nr:heparinase II/III family protein [Jeotgalibaca caeni]MDE1549333.1 heparinase II/III family protein [Jeotgalibaca caeni]